VQPDAASLRSSKR